LTPCPAPVFGLARVSFCAESAIGFHQATVPFRLACASDRRCTNTIALATRAEAESISKFSVEKNLTSTRIGRRFQTSRPNAARLPRSFFQKEKAKPRNSKARQGRAVQSGETGEYRSVAGTKFPENEPEVKRKNAFPLTGGFAPISGLLRRAAV
jgi:hypothetical protein